MASPLSRLPSRFLGAFALLVATVSAQDTRPVALVHARVLTMTDDGILEGATILIRDGRIEAVGTDVRPPAGARIVDVKGGTVMPGMVQAWSGAGVAVKRSASGRTVRRVGGRFVIQNRSSASKPQNLAARKVADGLYTRQEVFGDILSEGVTTLVVRPVGTGFPGLAARLDPSAPREGDGLVVDDDAYLVIQPANDSKSKTLIAESFDKAKELLEERKKPAPEKPDEQKKPADEKPAEAEEKKGEPAEEEKKEPPKDDEPKPEGEEKPKPAEEGEKKPAEQKPAPPKKKTDPNLEVLADVIDGKRPAFLRVSSATDLQHWMGGIGERRFPEMVVVLESPDPSGGRIDQALDELRELSAPVLMAPHLPNAPYSRAILNPARALHDAGIEFGFVLPEGDRSLVQLRFILMEMTRAGLPADVALRAVTAAPAGMLGLGDEVGTIAAERRANLLVFDGDPLDPAANLDAIWIDGRETDSSERDQ